MHLDLGLIEHLSKKEQKACKQKQFAIFIL